MSSVVRWPGGQRNIYMGDDVADGGTFKVATNQVRSRF